MQHSFDCESARKILFGKRRELDRGLSYAEKILFLHEVRQHPPQRLRPGVDQLFLSPDRVAMQDATAQMAMLQFMQTGQKKTHVSATIHCDHLIRAGQGADVDLQNALDANKEVYDFLSSAAMKYGIGFWGPGSGIIHQVLLENYAFPGGLMIGTDSHTPNAGGLGMIAIGVGGADAAEVMAGLPWETTFPALVGVRLTGALTGWASAKDVILEMLKRFTVKGGTGKIFEYFGEGAKTLSAAQKATITNMGAELGATSSVFAYDESMDAYLKNTGRETDAAAAAACSDILCRDEICTTDPERVYDQYLELDLGTVKPAHAGPFSPDRITKVENFRGLVASEKWPDKVSAVLMGSCTNSSYSDLYAVAQILEQGERHGCRVKVPFMLSPGSEQIYETIKRDGILQKLVSAGAVILAAACGPCIGQWDRKDSEKGLKNIMFSTFNRNFKARNDANPETLAFLTSPAMAACLALSGNAGFNPETDGLTGADGEAFHLRPPDPPPLPEKGLALYKSAYVAAEAKDKTFPIKIDPHSERLELLKPFAPWDGNDFRDLPVLVKTRGKTTTDHISPGGKWLKYRGHLTHISQNMLAGALNAFTHETGHGTDVLTGEKGIKFSELAGIYQKKCGGFIIVGDENYGEGSSREHAAMSPRFLGAKTVITRSFARIHEANLKKQGVLPLTFANPSDYGKISEDDRISLVGLETLRPHEPVRAIIQPKEGPGFEIELIHTLTDEQIKWFKAGSALNTVRRLT
ncbi:MAG: aconitate hydratase [Deltaproteobacteria bacterium]|nr:aconitate hydratase [Deltaproteobacteria bacterium]